MSIKSVDMQVLVQKVGEVARIQQAEQAGAHKNRQEFAEAISAQTVKNSKTPRKVEQKKAEMNTEKDKDKEKKKSRKKAGQQESKDIAEQELFLDPDKGSKVDIKI